MELYLWLLALVSCVLIGLAVVFAKFQRAPLHGAKLLHGAKTRDNKRLAKRFGYKKLYD